MLEWLEEYSKHFALNLGQALQGVRYVWTHPDIDELAPRGHPRHLLLSFGLRSKRIINDLFFALIPPHWHHSKEELSGMRRTPFKRWFQYGYCAWRFTDDGGLRGDLAGVDRRWDPRCKSDSIGPSIQTKRSDPIEKAALTTTSSPEVRRIASIDVLRGLIMVLMALDHTRDFFTDLTFEPETLSKTNGALFATRWVTHFCAPMFFFLAGTSAFLQGRKESKSRLAAFLATRGLWLILLEFTLVGTAWSFMFPWGFFGVIWALGASMLVLAALVRLPMRWLIGLAATVIGFHDLLDPIRPEQAGPLGWLWGILHVRGDIQLPGGAQQFVLFPLIPLTAVMVVGYVCGPLFVIARERRQRILLVMGVVMTAAFVFLRFTNLYGNPPPGLGGVSQGDWHSQDSLSKTVILFLDVEKYPPSLQYLLMTLGPSILLLSALEHERIARVLAVVRTYGKTPLLFYVLYLYLIHTLAVLVALATCQPVNWLFHGGVFTDTPAGYGHGLAFIYIMWVCVLAALYIPCHRFAAIKSRRRDWWLSYL